MSEAQAGKAGRCPRCKNKLTVPQPPEPELRLVRDETTVETPIPSMLLDDVPVRPQAVRLGKYNDPHEHQHAQELLGPESAPETAGVHKLPWLIDIMLYPVNISGIIHVLIFSLAPPVWAQAATRRFWMSPGIGGLFWLVLLTLYFLHYLAACLSDSAEGGTRAADINSGSSPLSVDALLSTFTTVFPAVALIWGPALAYYVVRARVDWILLIWIGAAGFMFPMVAISVNYFDSCCGANPILVLSSILSVPGPYGGLVVCTLILTGLAGLLMYLSGPPYRMWIVRPLLIYVLLVQTHLLGRFYRQYRERLNWGA
ncbi:MAG: hypothetical protein A2Y76_10230 [Planctomycetes bacterium RBG_13_60_9]|nr:MAG: hypothetical protein A2Y76_10230 [Planctomycetes bacterium RBG_13_60_9]